MTPQDGSPGTPASEAPAVATSDGRPSELPDLEVIRRAEARGFDPVRVALALGVDLRLVAGVDRSTPGER